MFYYIVKNVDNPPPFGPNFGGTEIWAAVVPKDFWDTHKCWPYDIRGDYGHILDPIFDNLRQTHQLCMEWQSEDCITPMVYNDAYKKFMNAGPLMMKSAEGTEDEIAHLLSGAFGANLPSLENTYYDQNGKRRGINWDASNERKRSDLMRHLGIVPDFQKDIQEATPQVYYAPKELVCEAMDSTGIFEYNESIHAF